MAYVRKIDSSGKWLGGYRDPSGKTRYTVAFTRKRDAERAAQEQERRIRTGQWTDPAGATITVGELAEHWFAVQNVSEKTLANRRHVLDRYILPAWGKIEVGRVTNTDVRRWVANLRGKYGQPLSPSTVRKAHWVLSSILNLAVEEGRVSVNRAHDATGRVRYLPKARSSREHVFLAHRQLARLVECTDEQYRTLVLLLGLTGLRPGEALALTVGDFDMLRRRIFVGRAYRSVNGKMILKGTKTDRARSVAFPRSLVEPLAVDMAGKGRSDLVWTTPRSGAPIEQSNLRDRVVKRAVRVASRAVELLQESLGVTPVDGVMGERTVTALRLFQIGHGLVASGETHTATWAALLNEATGVRRCQTLRALQPVTLREGDRDFSGDFTTYDLRHTAASLAISAGANVKAVQSMLGHAKASMTLDVYAGLFGDDLDAVAERIDALLGNARSVPEPGRSTGVEHPGFSEAGDHPAAVEQRGGSA